MDPQALPAEQSFAMATIIGARALRMDKMIGGSIPERGKQRADVITLRVDRPHAVPMYNVYSQLVYSLKKESDISDVMVNGKQIVRDPPDVDAKMRLKYWAKAAEYQLKVSNSLK